MSLSIPGQPQPYRVENRSAAGLSHLQPGDVIEARIIEIASSGRTVFQFAGFRAVAAKPVAGAQTGDVVQFTLVPDENDTAERQEGGRLPTRAAHAASGPRDTRPGPSNQLQLRLTTIPEKGLSATPLEKTSTGILTRPEMTDSRPLDHTRDPWGNGFAVGFQIGHRSVKMKMQQRSKGGAKGDDPGALTAAFLLNLEGSGAVRVDVHMAAHRIQVGFWVENEEGRRRLVEALPELSSALAPLAARCTFQVAVSPGKIREGDGGEEPLPKPTRLDVRA